MRQAVILAVLLLPASACISQRQCAILRLEAFQLGERVGEISNKFDKAEKLTDPFPKPLPKPRTEFNTSDPCKDLNFEECRDQMRGRRR